ncbi:MAG TPA: RdgB/HAM1 family non-canonical purine NTP pyrophosphatase [Limnochorda sp.]
MSSSVPPVRPPFWTRSVAPRETQAVMPPQRAFDSEAAPVPVREPQRRGRRGWLVLATRNRHKVAELRTLLAPFPWPIHGLDDFPGAPEVSEGASSYAANALAKARAAAQFTLETAMADDSGLEVDALHGSPGVLSARFAGATATDQDRNRALLKLLEGVPWERRTARFRCVIAVVRPTGEEWTEEGVLEGYIASEPRGESGFGYDPIFWVPELGKTLGEVGPEVKNRISHRARAVRKARERLLREAQGGMP